MLADLAPSSTWPALLSGPCRWHNDHCGQPMVDAYACRPTWTCCCMTTDHILVGTTCQSSLSEEATDEAAEEVLPAQAAFFAS